MAKRQTPDFHRFYPHHSVIHERLLNWARWVTPRTSNSVSPMFRNYRSHAWQWHTPEHRETCDLLDAMVVEKAVGRLPVTHREAVRWAYVYRCLPYVACRELGVSEEGLARHIHDGRAMLQHALDGQRGEGGGWPGKIQAVPEKA